MLCGFYGCFNTFIMQMVTSETVLPTAVNPLRVYLFSTIVSVMRRIFVLTYVSLLRIRLAIYIKSVHILNVMNEIFYYLQL